VSQGILYISYDGVLEPLGQSQVLAYLERLAPGRRVHLISFEKPADWARMELRRKVADRIRRAGIGWHPMTYHKSPSAPATAFDIAIGSAKAIQLVRRHKLSIVHARSYVGGLMALAAKKVTGARLLFDMRGFWADERVDSGSWTEGGKLHRAAKSAEKALLRNADQIVTLTRASAAELRRFEYMKDSDTPVTIIPTCADLDRFVPPVEPSRGPFLLGYAGSASGVYLLDDMLRFFGILRQERPDARLLMVNRLDHEAIRAGAEALGCADAVEIVAANHDEVPHQIARMSAGMALYKRAYSRVACAPTKLAEYLGCGVPCVASDGVGDMAEVIESENVGVVIRDQTDVGLRSAVRQLLDLTRDGELPGRCRRTARRLFSLEQGVAAYASIYDQLAPQA
jgi:glycosyltransferase involved in cell wall biosynthesis